MFLPIIFQWNISVQLGVRAHLGGLSGRKRAGDLMVGRFTRQIRRVLFLGRSAMICKILSHYFYLRYLKNMMGFWGFGVAPRVALAVAAASAGQ